MTVKCFWCGAINEKSSDFCCTCRRKLQWSTFFKALLRPSVGCLLGEEDSSSGEKLANAHTPVAVG